MNNKICVIGLGYVGLPLAHAFSFKYDTIIISVCHDEFKHLDFSTNKRTVIYDIKSILNSFDERL